MYFDRKSKKNNKYMLCKTATATTTTSADAWLFGFSGAYIIDKWSAPYIQLTIETVLRRLMVTIFFYYYFGLMLFLFLSLLPI